MSTALISFVKKEAEKTWKDDEEQTLRISVGKRFDLSDFQSIEKSYSLAFPDDYLSLVSELGLCLTDDLPPDLYGQMLTPMQIIEVLEMFKVWTSQHTYFDEEDEEEARLQQSIREKLIPFQYYGDGTALDVYCFVPSQVLGGELQVIVAYHDDDELECWFDGDGTKTWGFAVHMKEWIEEMQTV